MTRSVELTFLLMFALLTITNATSKETPSSTVLYEGKWRCESGPSISLSGNREKREGIAELAVTMSQMKAGITDGCLYLRHGNDEVVVDVIGSYNGITKRAYVYMFSIAGWNSITRMQSMVRVRKRSRVHKFLEKARVQYGNGRCGSLMELRFRCDSIYGLLKSHNTSETLQLHAHTPLVTPMYRRRYANIVAIIYTIQLMIVIYQILTIKSREQSLGISLLSITLLTYYTFELAISRRMLFVQLIMYACCAAYLTMLIVLMNSRNAPNLSLPKAFQKNVGASCVFILGFIAYYYAIQILLSFNSYLVALLQFSFFLPQIYRGLANDNFKMALHPSFVIVTALTTVSVPIYFFVNASRILNISPNPFYAFIVTIYVFAQAAYLLWRYFGANRNSEYTQIPSSVA